MTLQILAYMVGSGLVGGVFGSIITAARRGPQGVAGDKGEPGMAAPHNKETS